MAKQIEFYATMYFSNTHPNINDIQDGLNWIETYGIPGDTVASEADVSSVTYVKDLATIALEYTATERPGVDFGTLFDTVRYWITNNTALQNSHVQIELYVGDRDCGAD